MLCEVFDLPESDEYIQHEINAIKHALAQEATVQSHRALFKKDKLHTRRRVLLAHFGTSLAGSTRSCFKANSLSRALHESNASCSMGKI